MKLVNIFNGASAKGHSVDQCDKDYVVRYANGNETRLNYNDGWRRQYEVSLYEPTPCEQQSWNIMSSVLDAPAAIGSHSHSEPVVVAYHDYERKIRYGIAEFDHKKSMWLFYDNPVSDIPTSVLMGTNVIAWCNIPVLSTENKAAILRAKHGICVCPSPCKGFDDEFAWQYTIYINGVVCESSEDNYKTYEDALELGVSRACKIVKSGDKWKEE